MSHGDTRFAKWTQDHFLALWNLYELLKDSGQDVFGTAFLQCDFFDFARFVSPEIDKTAIDAFELPHAQAKLFAPWLHHNLAELMKLYKLLKRSCICLLDTERVKFIFTDFAGFVFCNSLPEIAHCKTQ